MEQSRGREAWGRGTAYESYVGRWSRLVANEFVDWLALPPGARWLDVGCGTGALSRTILERATPAQVLGIDPSAGFISYARTQVCDPQIRFEVADARALPVETGAYDAVVAGLALNFVPDPRQAIIEMARAARPGGVVAVYVWDYATGMQMMRRFWDAAVALDPAAADLDEGRRFGLCQPGPLAQLFQAGSLTGVEVRAIDVPTVFRDFDDYWTPFLGGQGSAPGYVTSLSEAQWADLRERIRATLPIEADGSIHLMARAWAARAIR